MRMKRRNLQSWNSQEDTECHIPLAGSGFEERHLQIEQGTPFTKKELRNFIEEMIQKKKSVVSVSEGWFL